MIVRTQASFSATGERFTPSKVPTLFSDDHDPGAVGKSGRYRDIPVPFGSASFHAPTEVQSKIGWIYDRVMPIRDAMRAAGAESFTFSLTYTYDSQCSLSLSPAELKMISALNCAFHIDCLEA